MVYQENLIDMICYARTAMFPHREVLAGGFSIKKSFIKIPNLVLKEIEISGSKLLIWWPASM